jgi:hypothetical protein
MGPLCRYCGKPIAKRTRLVNVDHAETDQRQYHDHTEFWTHVYVTDETWPKNKADCQKLTNRQVVAVKYGAHVRGDYYEHRVRAFSDWDGESYDDPFFCNGDHAKRLGYLMADGGHCTKKYNEALRTQQEQDSP